MKNLFIIFIITLSISIAGNAQSGNIDLTFGIKGDASIPSKYKFGMPVLTKDATGNMYFAGNIKVEGDKANSFGVLKYKPNGTIDPLFGNAGLASIALSELNIQVNAATVDKDGNIYLAGFSFYKAPAGFDQKCLAVVKFLPTGKADLSFSEDGIYTYQFPLGNENEANFITVDASKNIFVGGRIKIQQYVYQNILVKLLPNGQLNTSFDGDGILQTSVGIKTSGTIKNLRFDPNGNIYILGTCYVELPNKQQASIVKVNTDGKLDENFGNKGVMTYTLNTVATYASELDISNPESMVLSATAWDTGDKFYIGVIKINSKGIVIGEVIKKELSFTSNSNPNINALTKDAAGNFYVWGSYNKEDGSLIGFMHKYNSRLAPDITFSGDGIVLYNGYYVTGNYFMSGNAIFVVRYLGESPVITKIIK